MKRSAHWKASLCGLFFAVAWNAALATTGLQAPVLSSPAENAAVPGTQITFSWQVVAGADRYRLEIRKKADASLFASTETGNVTSHAVTGFPDDGTEYKWRVQAGNGTVWGNWSAYRYLTNGDKPPVPVLSSPAENAAVPGTQITFSWQAAAGADRYRLEIRKKSDASLFASTETGNVTSHTVTGFPDDGTQYKWKVQAGDGAGWGYWSAYRYFANCENPPQIGLSRKSLNFGAVIGGPATQPQQVAIANTGGGTLNWTSLSYASWLKVAPPSGTGSGEVSISVETAGLAAGTYKGEVKILDAAAVNSPQIIKVILTVIHAGKSSPPFGALDTPSHGAIVNGAIPITGWVLDDIQASRVEIKRSLHKSDDPSAVGGDGLVYIGDASFIEGARPDIEKAYPNLPLNYRGGWGYMMLTNMLPDKGNGSFTLHAFAYDKEGTRIKLGQKTITGKNLESLKPFGTIDTPSQGGPASGVSYLNFAWILAPHPYDIPADGSTIHVFVNGVRIGSPSYNHFRDDIASLFPGLANSNGAVGLFILDTTLLGDGIHTIAWGVLDSSGNAEGIGSRYFAVSNIVKAETASTAAISEAVEALRPRRDFTASAERSATFGDVMNLPARFEAVGLRRGYEPDGRAEPAVPDSGGVFTLTMLEVERIEIALEGLAAFESLRTPRRTGGGDPAGNAVYSGFLVVGDELRPLPIGSTLDPAAGVFAWQPGPGFLGEYTLVFVRERAGGLRDKAVIKITMAPKF